MAVTSKEADAGTKQSPEFETELPEETARHAYSSAHAARRLAYACALLALLGGGAYVAANPHLVPPLAGMMAASGEPEETPVSVASLAPAIRTRTDVPVAPLPIAAEMPAPDGSETVLVPEPAVLQPVAGAGNTGSIVMFEPSRDLPASAQETAKGAAELSVTSASSDSGDADQIGNATDGKEWTATLNARLAETQPEPPTTYQKVTVTRRPPSIIRTASRPVPAEPEQVEPANSEYESRVASAPDEAAEPEKPSAQPELERQASLGQTPTQGADRPLTPRSDAAVERALATALGLDGLDLRARAELKRRLVKGECLSIALGEVMGQVPILAMRDLIRSLDSEC